MQGIFVQLSRLSFLIALWWLIFRVISTLRKDFIVAKTVKTKTKISSNAKTGMVENNNLVPKIEPLSEKAALLVITHGILAGTQLTLGNETITIGRAPNSTLLIDDDYTSAHHARLTKSGSQWYIEDLGSTNGTFLNQSRVHTSAPIPIDSSIRVGKTVFELRR